MNSAHHRDSRKFRRGAWPWLAMPHTLLAFKTETDVEMARLLAGTTS